MNPILACFTDSNPNVRYYATESLYNVVRVSRGTVLSQFNDIFTILVRLATDADQNVKNGSEMLDRIMKVCIIVLCLCVMTSAKGIEYMLIAILE